MFILDTEPNPRISEDVYINCPVVYFDMTDAHIVEHLNKEFQSSVFPELHGRLSLDLSDLIATKVRLEKK